MTSITLLTQSSCSSCDRAKEILSRLVLEFPVTVQEIGLDTEEGKDLAIKHAVMFAPGILVDGEMFSYGRLSENKLRKRLADSPNQ
ncbi:MAG: thioredoxin family protein [Actinobacteria bacterium]|nr:thioredoxin family protein [Actinomycetota bacterium]